MKTLRAARKCRSPFLLQRANFANFFVLQWGHLKTMKLKKIILSERWEEFWTYRSNQGNTDRLIPKFELYNALKRWSDSRGSIPTMTRLKKTLIEYCKYRDFEFNPESLCALNDNRILRWRDEGDRKIAMECICVHVPGNNIQLD